MKKIAAYTILIVLFYGFLLRTTVKADYVLPYPSYMPGNKLYPVSKIVDRLEAFWFFGNIASAKYHLKLADKYLVEAKTLFEYSQYLLAAEALQRSDTQFSLIPAYLKNARREGKDIAGLTKIVKEAAVKHEKILAALKLVLPGKFTWTPEKQAAQTLKFKQMLDKSINIRQIAITK